MANNGIGSKTDAVYPAAVIVLPFSPKLMPFEFEKTTFERLVEVDPALTLIAVRLLAIDAVRVPTPAPVLRPKLTLFELLKVIAESAFDVPPPAETLIAWLAVIVPTPAPVERPKVTPLLFVKVSADRAFDVPPPADTFKA